MSTPTDDKLTPDVDLTKKADAMSSDTESLNDGGRKALETERKARRDAERKNKELADKLAELEGANWRRDVADEKGLTAAQAKLLTGTSPEELAASADSILEAFNDAGSVTGPPTRKPTPDLRGGTDPNAEHDDPSGLADRLVSRGL